MRKKNSQTKWESAPKTSDNIHDRFTPERIDQEIRPTCKKRRNKMSLSFFDEIEARGKAEAVLGFLQKKLQRVPKKIETVVRRMSDPIALDSLVAYVVAYKGQDEFAESLK